MVSELGTHIELDASHYGTFFMYLGRRLKINIALNPKKKP